MLLLFHENLIKGSFISLCVLLLTFFIVTGCVSIPHKRIEMNEGELVKLKDAVSIQAVRVSPGEFSVENTKGFNFAAEIPFGIPVYIAATKIAGNALMNKCSFTDPAVFTTQKVSEIIENSFNTKVDIYPETKSFRMQNEKRFGDSQYILEIYNRRWFIWIYNDDSSDYWAPHFEVDAVLWQQDSEAKRKVWTYICSTGTWRSHVNNGHVDKYPGGFLKENNCAKPKEIIQEVANFCAYKMVKDLFLGDCDSLPEPIPKGLVCGPEPEETITSQEEW
jgi:hypothetical protein